MRRDRPSRTAAWVATCRGLGELLPPEDRVCRDPWGLRFSGRVAKVLAAAARRNPRITWRVVQLLPPAALSIFWVQLRTRVLDEMLTAFVQGGGRQVVLLGAGFDCRASRLAEILGDVVLFEVDHPATQAHKRQVLGDEGGSGDRVRYLPWDFEHDDTSELPTRLAALGHDRAQATFTLGEGITMYLSESAVDATVAAVRALSGPGSRFAVEYYHRTSIERQNTFWRLLGRVGIQRHEPFRFGWEPSALRGWFEQRGFRIESDDAEDVIAGRYLSARHREQFLGLRGKWRLHLALAAIASAPTSITPQAAQDSTRVPM